MKNNIRKVRAAGRETQAITIPPVYNTTNTKKKKTTKEWAKTRQLSKPKRNPTWELKFLQDGIRAQLAFEADVRFLNRLYYGKSSIRI